MGLIERFAKKDAHLGVIGLGYVGLPLAVAYAQAGFKVTGIERMESKISALQQGESYVIDVPSAHVAELIDSGQLQITSDPAVLAQVDSVNICVPTPLSKTRDPDISFIQDAVGMITPYLHRDMLVILESTTYPGTTEEVILPLLSADGLEVGKDFFLAFSPERVDPGNPTYHTKNIPKVVGGITAECCKVASSLYSQVMETVVPVSSARVAETVKLLENTFRSVNIGLVNEMALMCDYMDIDVWEVIEAAATKPFGYMPFFPGPGLGGHCIPIDPFYLSWKAKLAGTEARFIELAGQINGSMPRHVVKLVTDALNQVRKAVNGSKLLVVGVAYKSGIDDMRESPALDIIELLTKLGAEVSWFDPFVAAIPAKLSATRLTEWNESALSQFDGAAIITAHDNVEHALLLQACPAVVDTRNALKGHQSTKLTRL
ncbi:MAG: nucleotide sugar dehydrogenase [bacterium]